MDAFDGVIFATNSDAETLEGEVVGTEIGVPDLNDVKSLMVLNIFTIGILAGASDGNYLLEEIVMIDDVLKLYSVGVGCGFMLSFLPWVVSTIIRFGVDIMKKGGC